MAAHNIRIVLNEDEERFIKWLAKHDGYTVNQELKCLLQLELSEQQEVQASLEDGRKPWEVQ